MAGGWKSSPASLGNCGNGLGLGQRVQVGSSGFTIIDPQRVLLWFIAN
jgi:hypothetical protein